MASGHAGIEFILNGRPVRAGYPPSHRTLLDDLRARGLTGAKEGCAEGECGACTVLIVVPGSGAGSEYRAVNSCLMPVALASSHEILTVEAMARGGRLCEAQAAMARAGGSQCGYCTPGFVMSLVAEQYRPGRTGPCDLQALSGNLCRCTGYRPIRDAALSLGPAPDDELRARLSDAPPAITRIADAAFSRPRSIDECVTLLQRRPDAVLVAGATDLGVEANLKGRRWSHLIGIEGVDEMRDIRVTPESVRIGAAVPLSDIPRRWPERPRVVDHWLSLFASTPIRNRATLGGSLATASPIGDAAPLLMALHARVEVAGPSGRRQIPIDTFFPAYRKTALAPGELIVAIDIPLPVPAMLGFYKVSKRRMDDISTVAAGMSLDLAADGTVRRARFAFGGVAATPIVIGEAERAVVGTRWDDAATGRVKNTIEQSIAPMSDHRGSAEYRRLVAASLVDTFREERRR